MLVLSTMTYLGGGNALLQASEEGGDSDLVVVVLTRSATGPKTTACKAICALDVLSL